MGTQVVTTLVGLWFTHFTLNRVGQHDLGLWLIALQVTLYLSLLDLGVVGVLSRDLALAAGHPDPQAGRAAARDTLATSVRVMLWQMPLVAAAAVGVWLALPRGWAGLQQPLALILAIFVAAFPLRTLQATLTGLQDQTCVGLVQFAAWSLGTATAVAMLLSGYGLYALVASWSVAQLVPPAAYAVRMRSRFRHFVPRRLPRLAFSAIRVQLGRAIWVSIGQVTHLAVTGIDVLVIGGLLGPGAVVPYMCTGKLVAVGSGLPLSVAALAGPALGELRAREGPRRLEGAMHALGLAVLLLGGALSVVVLIANEGFVRLWVGAPQFGGVALTAAFVVNAMVRQWGATFGQAVFYGGHERKLGLNGLVESVVVVGLTIALVGTVGAIGAPLASLAGVTAVALPFALRRFATDVGSTAGSMLRAMVDAAWRIAVALGASLLLWAAWRPAGVLEVSLAATAAVGFYAMLTLPLLGRPPLKGYVDLILAPVWPAAASLLGGRHRATARSDG